MHKITVHTDHLLQIVIMILPRFEYIAIKMHYQFFRRCGINVCVCSRVIFFQSVSRWDTKLKWKMLKDQCDWILFSTTLSASPVMQLEEKNFPLGVDSTNHLIIEKLLNYSITKYTFCCNSCGGTLSWLSDLLSNIHISRSCVGYMDNLLK